MLRIIAGFEISDTGAVSLDGEYMSGNGVMVPAHKRNIGIVAQDGALFPHLDVAHNIGFGMSGGQPVANAQRIDELLHTVELDPAIGARRPHQLSGGQQQRVALARALARKPKLLLLDEPFSALDSGLRDHMRRAVARLLDASGMTAILVTHDQGEALSFADQVAVLRQGRLIQSGSPQDLYFRPVDCETAQFLGDAVIMEADIHAGMAECVLGRIPVKHTSGLTKAKIMVRPEQLVLCSSPNRLTASPVCPGQISFVEFSGATWTVGVSVAGSVPLVIKVSSPEAPVVGHRVSVIVSGSAHILPG